MNFWEILLGSLFLVICILLILIVLLQKGKGGGLGAAFGGMGSSAFGTRTGDVFTWVTIVLTGLFLLLAIGTSLALRPPPDLVNKPRFFPAPMPIVEGEKLPVRITCSTKGAIIRYTTDGSEPTENSFPYEKAVDVEPGMTLKARAFREKWEPSGVTSGTYELADPNAAALPQEGMIDRPTTLAPPTTAPATMPTAPTTAPATP